MGETQWLFSASVLVWLGLGGYLFLLDRKAARLEVRLLRLERESAFPTETGDE